MRWWPSFRRHFWVGVRRNFNIYGINSGRLWISQYSSNSLRKKKVLCNYPTLSLEMRHIWQGWPRVAGLPSPAQEPGLQEQGDKISLWEGWEVGRWVRRELISKSHHDADVKTEESQTWLNSHQCKINTQRIFLDLKIDLWNLNQ